MVSPPNQSPVRVGIEICRREIIAVAIDVSNTVMPAAIRPSVGPDETVGELTSLIQDLKASLGHSRVSALLSRAWSTGVRSVLPISDHPEALRARPSQRPCNSTRLTVTMENDANAARVRRISWVPDRQRETVLRDARRGVWRGVHLRR